MKNSILLFAMCGMVLTTSCSQVEIIEEYTPNAENPEQIHFQATTTRATISDLTSSKIREGFNVYASSGNATTDFYSGVDGAAYYMSLNNNWTWVDKNTNNPVTAPQWPVEHESYPMSFYAFYPVADDGFSLTPNISSNGAVMKASITIQTRATVQRGFLAAKRSIATAADRPTTGKLEMTFKHITSKINFGFITGSGITAHVSDVSIHNIRKNGTYDYVTEAWDFTTLTSEIASYSYFTTKDAITKGSPATTAVSNATLGNGITKTAIYPYTSTDHHLMLIPQKETPIWDEKGVACSDATALGGQLHLKQVHISE